jgi:cation diffusion facilitator CzcD-associated flavoprotein CzcO
MGKDEHHSALPLARSRTPTPGSPMTHVAIIGGDAAGMSAASLLRRRAPAAQITVFEKGPYTSYAL